MKLLITAEGGTLVSIYQIGKEQAELLVSSTTGKASLRRCPDRRHMNKYRYSDYYQMTETFDSLYRKSREGHSFKKLMNIIKSDNNIKLAYRMIKSNTGSKTAGVDGITIANLKDEKIEHFIRLVKQKLESFSPDTVKRVFIPKEYSDKKRPLGIPTMIDRMVQQAIRQVLEPICEAKFHPHSYGFRPNRSTHHALARMNYLINQGKFYHVVDVDIKGFFDNVNHNKLIKQIYTMGIRDRKILCIIKAMLKAPIKGEGIPSKGTPQGGILSPLLSNIVLNELDWWVSSQWETYQTNNEYANLANRYRAMKKSKLKQIFIIRYADDFKILCKTHNQARRIFIAVEKWLKERLGLDTSPEKSQIVDLRKKPSEFLGFEIRAKQKRKKLVAFTHVKKKGKTKIRNQLLHHVRKVQANPTPETVNRINSVILGMHNYYSAATHVWKDFGEIAFLVYRKMYNRLWNVAKYEKVINKSKVYDEFYGKCDAKTWIISGMPIFPIHYIHHRTQMSFSQDVSDYTPEGRKKSTKALKSPTYYKVIELAMKYVKERSIEYNDNRISRASMCNFECEVTGTELEVDNLHAHHRIPRKLGGTDEFNNLRIVHADIHKLIHATSKEVINKYIYLIREKKALKKLNTLRSYCKLEPIAI